MSPSIALRFAALALLVALACAQTSPRQRVDVATRTVVPATVVPATRPTTAQETNVSSRIFSPFYWGPQGYIIGPSWFGAGLGGIQPDRGT